MFLVKCQLSKQVVSYASSQDSLFQYFTRTRTFPEPYPHVSGWGSGEKVPERTMKLFKDAVVAMSGFCIARLVRLIFTCIVRLQPLVAVLAVDFQPGGCCSALS